MRRGVSFGSIVSIQEEDGQHHYSRTVPEGEPASRETSPLMFPAQAIHSMSNRRSMDSTIDSSRVSPVPDIEEDATVAEVPCNPQLVVSRAILLGDDGVVRAKDQSRRTTLHLPTHHLHHMFSL
jgi:hypothetical protein